MRQAAAWLPVALLLAGPATAQESGDQPVVRARIETDSPAMVGETVTLTVDVLTPTWFPRAPQFPAALQVENAVAVFDESFRVNLSERVGSDTWSGIQRRYLIYPQLAGVYSVPPVEVKVVYALPNARPSEPIALAGPPLHFEARVPPEAAGLDYFIAARGFALEQKVEPGTEGLRVGDAVTRTVTLRATDASSMMLPTTEFPTIDGLSVYADPTRAGDGGGERGEARRARRVDRATYVLKKEGSFTLPAIERSWWDVSAQRLRQASVPAVPLEVAPAPDLAGEIALPEEPEDAEGTQVREAPRPRWWRREVVLGLVVLVVLGGLAWRFLPAWRAVVEERRRRRRESEAAFFDRVLAACRCGDAPGAMRALLAWVDRVTPSGQSPTLGRLLARVRDSDLTSAVRDLESSLYRGGGASGWRGEALARHLERVRRAHREIGRPAEAPLLAPLNPSAPEWDA